MRSSTCSLNTEQFHASCDVLMVMLFKLDPFVEHIQLQFTVVLNVTRLRKHIFNISNYVHSNSVCMIITHSNRTHTQPFTHPTNRTYEYLRIKQLSSHSIFRIQFDNQYMQPNEQQQKKKTIKNRRKKQNWKDLCRHVFLSVQKRNFKCEFRGQCFSLRYSLDLSCTLLYCIYMCVIYWSISVIFMQFRLLLVQSNFVSDDDILHSFIWRFYNPSVVFFFK